MTFCGMDTEQAQQFAQTITDGQQQVAERRDELERVVQGLDGFWRGPDADEFRDRWSETASGIFTTVADALTASARELVEQAQEQELVSAAEAMSALADVLHGVFRLGHSAFVNPLTAFADWRNYLTGAMGLFTQAGEDMLKLAADVYARGGEEAIVPWLREAYGLKSAGKVLGPLGTALTGVFAGVDRWNQDASDPSVSTTERVVRTGVDAGANVAGAWGGAVAGAEAGAAIGSIFPGPGTVIGGVVGGLAGGILGGGVANSIGDWLLG